jgi:hypothetical protein
MIKKILMTDLMETGPGLCRQGQGHDEDSDAIAIYLQRVRW